MFKLCCSATFEGNLKDRAFEYLNQENYEEAEIALRSYLTYYIKLHNEHTVPLAERDAYRADILMKVDIEAVSEGVFLITRCLIEQNKQAEIIPFLYRCRDIINDDRYKFNIAYQEACWFTILGEGCEKDSPHFISPSHEASYLIDYQNKNRLGEMLRWVIKTLRMPAGEDEKFSSFDSMRENWDEFVSKVHFSWKILHLVAIREIMTVDQGLKFAKKNKKNKNLIKSFELRRLIWRRVNDSLIWFLTRMKRHIVKRMCFYREHGFLADQNPTGALTALVRLNCDPYSIAVWNDATSCADVGDITCLDTKKGFNFYEIKEGQVNEAMLPAFHCDRAMYFFLQKYGKKGKEQVLRVIKQMDKSTKVLKLLKEDKGIDPMTGQQIMMIESKVLDEFYDDELDKIITKARENGEANGLIDECLWIYANTKRDIKQKDLVERFTSIVFEKDDGRIERWLAKHMNKKILYPTFSLRQGLSLPVTLPIFLRNLADETVVDILLGNIAVLLFLDWVRLAQLFRNVGLKLNWSSRKEGRQSRHT